MRAQAFAFATVLLAAVPALAQQTILPGYWESTSTSQTSFSKGEPKTERRCITPDKVEAFFSAPSNSHYTCTYDKRTIHGGVADFRGQCVDKHGTTFEVTMHGTYSPEAFHLDARFALPNVPMLGGSGSIEAHRLGADCPAAQ